MHKAYKNDAIYYKTYVKYKMSSKVTTEQKKLLETFPQSIQDVCKHNPNNYHAINLLLLSECMRDDPEGSLSPCFSILTKYAVRYHCNKIGGISAQDIEKVIKTFPFKS